mmetsp:Transcript_30458/g.89039  ORF Transcript_30458/g.89039 Transcript_30458/m.89039 type:complete len:211 (+) Transcript_30458:3345-3977(+)
MLLQGGVGLEIGANDVEVLDLIYPNNCITDVEEAFLELHSIICGDPVHLHIVVVKVTSYLVVNLRRRQLKSVAQYSVTVTKTLANDTLAILKPSALRHHPHLTSFVVDLTSHLLTDRYGESKDGGAVLVASQVAMLPLMSGGGSNVGCPLDRGRFVVFQFRLGTGLIGEKQGVNHTFDALLGPRTLAQKDGLALLNQAEILDLKGSIFDL